MHGFGSKLEPQVVSLVSLVYISYDELFHVSLTVLYFCFSIFQPQGFEA